MTANKNFLKLFSVLAILAIMLSNVQPPRVQAQGGDGLKRQINAQNGRVHFIGPENGRALPASKALGLGKRPQDPGMALAEKFGPEFGLKNPGRELAETKKNQDKNGKVTVKYQQKHEGVPVMAGELIVNTDENGDLYSINGEISPDLSLSTQPTIDSEQAQQSALQAMAKWYQKNPEDFVSSVPELWIYDESLLQPSTRPVELTWRMEITAKDNSMPVRELMLVNAERGNISLHFNQVDTAWSASKKADDAPTPTPQATETPLPTAIPPAESTSLPVEEPSLTEQTPNPVVVDAQSENLSAATWYVAPTGNDASSCSAPVSPCKTIQAAVDKAAAGDTVKVAIGTYTGTSNWLLVLNKDITILGGWDSSFTVQKGMSTLDGQRTSHTVGTAQDIVATIDHLLIINSSSNGISTLGGTTLTVNNSTVANSQGGISASGILYLNNSTISNNSGMDYGGISAPGTIRPIYINNSTIADNFSSGTAGGIQAYYAQVHIRNSIVARNIAATKGPNCYTIAGPIISEGHNLFGNIDDCNITLAQADQANKDPQLTDLLSVGYHALLSNSPAINGGDVLSCLSIDQRGVARGSTCDIGAYEYTLPAIAASLALQAGNNQRVTVNYELPVALQALVLDSVGSPVSNASVTFTSPSSGPGGTFAGTHTATSQTNQSGIATAPVFTANNLTGSYSISATVANLLSPAIFSVTNSGWFIAPTGSDQNSCSSPSSPCASFAAVINKAYSGDTIFVAEGTYYGYGGDIIYLSQDQRLDFIGGWNASFTARTGRSTLEGRNVSRGINNFRGYVTFEHFIIQNCNGGGIYSGSGTLKLVDSIVKNNRVTSYGGAGIFAGGNVTVIDSLITNNSSEANSAYPGAGISHQGTLTLINSTVSNNKAVYSGGGGIHTWTSGSLILQNSTISGNSAAEKGGGIHASYGSAININNSTITNNSAQTGGGIFIENLTNSGTYNIQNSIIANNIAGDSGSDCYNIGNPFDILKYSLLGNTSNCTAASETANLKNVASGLSLLAVGWPGFHPLASNSPAINAGDPNTCLVTDQRGVSRGSSCDMGAFEYTPAGSPSTFQIVSGSSQRTPPGSLFGSPLKVMVTDVNNNLVNGVNVTFSAPSSGPSGTFSTTHTNIATVQTQADGVATSPSFTANNLAGGYIVSSAVTGIPNSVQFQLTNYDSWYVTPIGNDANNCMAASTPCASINGPLAKSLFLQGDTIKVAGGIYQAGSSVSEVVNFNKSANISGGWNSTFTMQNQVSVIDGQGARRGINILAGINISLDHVTIKNGYVTDKGGGIWNSGNLTVSDCLIEKNRAGTGGGISNSGGLAITNCTIQNNTAGAGGGINSDSPQSINIDRTKIIGNDAINQGGGINYHSQLNYSYDATKITNSVISGNTAGDGGGIFLIFGNITLSQSSVLYNAATSPLTVPVSTGGGINISDGILYVNNSTISSNYANGDGGGLNNENGHVYLNNATVTFNFIPLNRHGAGIYQRSYYSYQQTIIKNSLIALNSGGGDCDGNVISNGYNLVGNIDFCNYTSSTGDLLGTSKNQINPLISLPRDNGGLTFTQALFTNSPALNTGNPATPGSNQGACFTTDQRGVSRLNTGICDIGAFEGSVPPLVEPNVAVFTNNNQPTNEMLNSFLCGPAQVPCTNGSNLEADNAQDFAMGMLNFYYATYGRNGIDDRGTPIFANIDYAAVTYCPNAAWNGEIIFLCDGTVTDDILAHELTHAVTQYESNLFSYYQSGAINESFSDLWGEYYDQINGKGNDAVNFRWLIGEDSSAMGAIRSMSNPPAYSDPDKMSSAYYYEGEDDSGGIHSNSGLNNKAVYLMVDGGTFNGKTVNALGWDKTASIYYEVNKNLLTSGADYSDLYYALQQACTTLIGQKGITVSDCAKVKDAIDAVEMNGQPASNFNTDAPLCTTTGTLPNILFADDLENGTGNWIFTNGNITRWQYDSPYGLYAQSGLHSLYADDYPATITDAKAQLTSIYVPANTYLHFAQAYEFEYGAEYYDGGILEYSTNGGSTWTDAGSLIDYNGYKGKISSKYQNPLANRSAFVGSSHGYISTRLNLTSLAGKTVNFRWRMGLDTVGLAVGWWVDNVQLYNCVSPVISGNAGAPGVILSYTDGTAKSVVSGGDGSYTLSVSYNWSGTVTPSHLCYSFTPVSRTYNTVKINLTNQNYTVTPSVPCVLSIVRANTNPASPGSTVGFTVTFTKPVTGVDVSDFTLATGGITGASISNVTGSGTTYTVTVNTGSGRGSVRLDVVDDDSIKDGSNVPLGGAGVGNGNFTSGERYNIVTGADTTGVFRPSNGALYLKNTNDTGFADVQINYGVGGDYPVTGDWDGDGVDTIGIYRIGYFYLRNSNTIGYADYTFAFGAPGDQPVAGDWNGDGKDTIGVYRNGTFYLRNSNTPGAPDMIFSLGVSGDVGIAGDWTGKGYDTTGVFRPSNGALYLKNKNETGYADVQINYGQGGDRPVTGDWNNDGTDTIGVYRNGSFYLRNSNTIGYADIVFALGIPGDMPIAGNWDGKP